MGSAENARTGVQGAPRGQTIGSIGEVTFSSSNWGRRSGVLVERDGLREDAGGGDGCRLACLGLNLSASTYHLCDFGQVP